MPSTSRTNFSASAIGNVVACMFTAELLRHMFPLFEIGLPMMVRSRAVFCFFTHGFVLLTLQRWEAPYAVA